MKRLWGAVVLVVGVACVMLGSASAGTQLQPIQDPYKARKNLAVVVRLQVTPPANAPVNQDVTMRVTIENQQYLLLAGGAHVVYQFGWNEHAHGQPSGRSGYHPDMSWTFRPTRANLYALRVSWAIADTNGNVGPSRGLSDSYQLTVCAPAQGQPSC
jgi:hypothetical protein